MTDRQRLPNRRRHELHQFQHGGIAYTAGVGRFADDRLAEIFLNSSKSGTAVEAWARDAAIVASLALQHGVDVATIRHGLSRDAQGGPASPLGALLDLLDLLEAEGAVPHGQ